MNFDNLFSTWRAEIEDELSVAEAEYQGLETVVADALAETAQAQDRRNRLRDLVFSGVGKGSLAGALNLRLQNEDDAPRRAACKHASARSMANNVAYRIQDLQEALAQLDRIERLATEASAARVLLPATQPKLPVIDLDYEIIGGDTDA